MKNTLTIFLFLFLFISCSEKSKVKKMAMEIQSTPKNIKIFRNTNIYFGHQSVGNNIINGIKSILHDNAIKDLNIFDLNEISKLPENYFVHSQIGKNRDPFSKIDDFQKKIVLLKNKKLEIAMMKFCYVDFNSKSNINKIFNHYVKAIDSIKVQNPNLIILHCTVPLTTDRSFLGKIKAFAKGKLNETFDRNFIRNRYNDLVRSKYPSKYIFDIAKIESTNPNGKREIKTMDSKSCYFLSEIYSSDGGHLNILGQKILANELINKITEISSELKE